jgi:hypothetical protein
MGGSGMFVGSMTKEGPLDEAEVADLKFMREEEKMARDLYQKIYEEHGIRIFANIAKSEQHHMDLVKAKMDIEGILDPVGNNGVGIFTNTTIQDLYTDLLADGLTNLSAALRMGHLVEERDISDLDIAIDESEKKGLDSLYGTLQRASKNHLRAFARALSSMGEEPYVPTYMDSYEYADILN